MGFQQGLSGLNVASKNLDVIGNNVANASTVGFKAGQAQFADVFAASLSGSGTSPVGLGAKVATVVQQFSQGNVTTTNNPLDMAVNGGGFYVLSNGGTTTYSRNGQFQLDANGYVVNAQGLKLQGYSADSTGRQIITGPVSDLRIFDPTSSSDSAPQATGASSGATGVQASVNLDSREAVPTVGAFSYSDPSSFNQSTAVAVYDSLGNAHTLNIYYVKVDPTSADALNSTPPVGPNTWDVYMTVTNPAGATPTFSDLSAPAVAGDPPVRMGRVVFDSSGKVSQTYSVTGTSGTSNYSVPSNTTMALSATGAGGPDTLSFDMTLNSNTAGGTPETYSGITVSFPAGSTSSSNASLVAAAINSAYGSAIATATGSNVTITSPVGQNVTLVNGGAATNLTGGGTVVAVTAGSASSPTAGTGVTAEVDAVWTSNAIVPTDYSSIPATPGTDTVQFSSPPVVGDAVTLNGVTFTFQDAGLGNPDVYTVVDANNVTISTDIAGADLITTAAALAGAIGDAKLAPATSAALSSVSAISDGVDTVTISDTQAGLAATVGRSLSAAFTTPLDIAVTQDVTGSDIDNSPNATLTIQAPGDAVFTVNLTSNITSAADMVTAITNTTGYASADFTVAESGGALVFTEKLGTTGAFTIGGTAGIGGTSTLAGVTGSSAVTWTTGGSQFITVAGDPVASDLLTATATGTTGVLNINISSAQLGYSATVPPTPPGTTIPGVNPLGFVFDMRGTTQYGAGFGVNSLVQDGFASGKLSGFNVGKDGVVLGRYTNGQTNMLGQVVLASFRNPQGLQPLGDNQWAASSDSGQAIYGSPGSSGNFGPIQSAAVEDSNVDLTAELVNMITAQRVYQANAQTIKTQDQILQTLVNLR